MKLDEITIGNSIDSAETMPSHFYTDRTLYDKVVNQIFSNSWQLVHHKSVLINNINPFTFLKSSVNEPLVLTNKDNQMHILSNVCTHRGHIVQDKVCSKNQLQCRYHGRKFCLDGKFISAPGFERNINFPSKSDNLKSLPVFSWNSFIFTILNEKYQLKPIMKQIDDRLSWFPFDMLVFDEKNSQEYIINANWALYCENYLEGLHVPFVHRGLSKDIVAKTYATEILNYCILQTAESKNTSLSLSQILGSDIKENIYAYYFFIFPNMMINVYHWGISINIIEPISVNRTRVKFLSFPVKGGSQGAGTDSSIDIVEMEDQKVVESVQKGMKSSLYQRGRYSAKHEKGVHYFHQLLAKYSS